VSIIESMVIDMNEAQVHWRSVVCHFVIKVQLGSML
jgi:hypothetical protein